ncbi:MAG: GDSL family lipase [Sphingomonadales bacterium]|nr:GDSL family lipase [Sphingomonadales bacterium]
MRRAASILTALAALAGASSARAADPVPPGEGMIEQPCPVQDSLWFGSAYVRQYDWAWLCRFRAENESLAKGAPPLAVFIGDSITEGWIKLDPDFFARRYADRGISGQTSPQVLLRFRQDVVGLHPRVVHIMVGTNDVAGNTGPTRAEDWQNAMRAMVEQARANRIKVVVGSLLPAARFPWRPALQPAPQIAALNAWLRGYAHDEHLVYADYHTALAAPDGSLKSEYSADGVHPNAAGYAVMRTIAARALAQADRRLRQ